jgi:hypothetical protein
MDMTLTESIFVGAGLLVTLILGLYCECFLKKSVTAPPIFKHEVGGGGKQLGVLERLLFFGSFLLGEYTLTAGWLAFKVAAKWASWQHVIKISDKADETRNVNVRVIVSSRLLGRFLNGTLYNALCACIGVLVGKFVSHLYGYPLKNASGEVLLWILFTLTVVAVIILTGASLFCFDLCRDPEAEKKLTSPET